jgi:hypothetical protein
MGLQEPGAVSQVATTMRRRQRHTIRFNQTPRPPPRRRDPVLVVATTSVAASLAVLVAWLVFTLA